MHLKPFSLLFIALTCLLVLCKSRRGSTKEPERILQKPAEDIQLHTVADISLPAGFTRLLKNNAGFASWLLKVKIKKDKTVYLYNGHIKPNQQAQYAVLDINVPPENLQQCADAVMRLRAEFLFAMHRYDLIKFLDNNGKVYQFSEPYNRTHLKIFLRQVFAMCGTASLAKQLKNKNIKSMESGDVLIRGGFPGHAVIVIDVAENPQGKKIYLLAQSFMPAQDIHILKNPANSDGNPWYEIDSKKYIVTPEYTFTKDELKGW